jgi:hypothetical protein
MNRSEGGLGSGIDVFTWPITALTAVIGMTAVAAVPAASTAPLAVSVVTTGPPRSIGEPAAAQDPSVSAAVATTFGAGARATVWTRRADSRTWTKAGVMLPDGFGESYDASAAALPGGSLLLVAGMAPSGSCIANGSVGIADVYPDGHLGETRLVSDQRGTGAFDDRPAVAAAAGGLVWVAWSQGRNTDSCQNVGHDDRMTVSLSSDGGSVFGTPVTLPSLGGYGAFGARLAPLGGGRVAVSWTETMPGGQEAVLVAVAGPGRRVSTPRIVLRADPPPLVLPGASFYDFPAGALTVLPDGTLVVAAPLWRDDHSVIEVAAGPPGGPWRIGAVPPPPGADLLLPALGPLGSSGALLLCAVHYRTGDRLGYAAARFQAGTWPMALTTLTPAPAGPGFYEIGEEASMTQAPAGLIAPVVVGGRDGAALETLSWKAPPPAPAPSPSPSRTVHHSAQPIAVTDGYDGGTTGWLLPVIAAAVALIAAATWAMTRRFRDG